MLIKYQALTPTLNKKIHALNVLIGNDPYLLNDAAVQIKSVFLKRSECEQTVIDIQKPADWSTLIAEANSYSLFSENILLDARYDKKTVDALGKELLVEYLDAINERCSMILRAPQLSSKALAWLIDNPNVLVIQISALTPAALKQWIQTQIHHRNLHAEAGVESFIQYHTQGNMLATAQLLEKLSLCTKPGECITLSMIQAHLNDQAHFELYELATACLSANAAQSLRLLQQFRLERVEPILVLWVLTQEIRLLIQLHALLKQSNSIESACSQLKIWSSRVAIYAQASRRLSVIRLHQLLQECQHLDETIKMTQNLHIWDHFELIALTLCGAQR